MITQARQGAVKPGFEGLWISDHYHPWNDAQGHSGFVWGTIGAIATAAPGMHVTTAVTCPTIRIHPAVIAQAAATAAVLLDGQFALGVGSGEALNEHIFGDAVAQRRRAPGDAGGVDRGDPHAVAMRRVPRTTVAVTTASNTPRIYDLPGEPTADPRLRGSGPKAIELAGRIADGFCTVTPDADAVRVAIAPHGGEGKLVQGGTEGLLGSG